MKNPEILLDDIPAPGEPLKPRIHEFNQKLLDEEMQARAAMVRARLTPKELKALNKRHAELHKILNQANYNAMIKERWWLLQSLESVKHDLKTAGGAKADKLAAKFKTIKARGIMVHAAIQPLIPFADEFESITRRLQAHEEVMKWEREDAENQAQFRREALVWEQQLKAVMRQSKRLHHLRDDKDGRTIIDIPIIEKIIFKDDRVLYQVKTTYQTFLGRLFNRWESALPYNVDIDDLTCEETLANLGAGCNRVVTVERSKMGTNLFYVISRLDAPDGVPRKVLYSKIIDFYPARDHAKTPWPMGQGENRKALWADFETYPHILLGGSSRGGKSNHLNAMIATMVTMATPSELMLLLIDLKGGIEFTHWSGLKHQIRPMVKRTSEVLDALRFMHAIMERRLVMFEAIKAKNLESYNEKAATKLPRLIVVIDEMATLMGLGELTKDIHNELNVLSSQGRAVGIHLILCTQHPSVEIIPGFIKTNMGIRASTSMPTHAASEVILGTPSAARIPKIAGRMVISMGRDEQVVQSPYISDAEIARAVEISRLFPDPDMTEFDLSKKEPVAPPKEKFSKTELLEIIMTEFEGYISGGRIYKHLGGKENDVISERKLKAMVSEFIDIGLEKGVTYQNQYYRLKKVKGPGNYTLVLSGQSSGQETDTDLDEVSMSQRPDRELETV